MDKVELIKYGGAVTGWGEFWAIIKSLVWSWRTRNWQQGPEGAKFEKELAHYLKVKHAILTNSGSSAGLLVLSALELPRGSEVIISAVTFPTIFNIILQCGLVPVVVDAKVGTYGFDVDEVKNAITSKTRAIIAIHPLGNPVHMPHLMKVVRDINKKRSKDKKIYVIEDNCDGLGGTFDGQQLGSFGDISITSLHAAHIVSMGVGGVVFTSSDILAQRVRMYRDWGRQADINESKNTKHKSLPKDYNPRFIYEKVGYNFQILDLQAAMGRVQLRKIKDIKETRRDNFWELYLRLSKHSPDHLILPKWHEGADVCWFAFPLTYTGDRGKLLHHLEERGIETRPMFSGNILRHPAYGGLVEKGLAIDKTKPSKCETITNQSFWISCHPALTQNEMDRIVKAFDDFFA